MKLPVYNTLGEKVSEADMPSQVFEVAPNNTLLHEVMVASQANRRFTLAHTKTRGEVRGGGRKPWRQKGTGRARHGSRRSPLWVGGGVTFGPRSDRNASKKINKKVALSALAMVLSDRASGEALSLIDSYEGMEFKTSSCYKLLDTLTKGKEVKTLVVLDSPNKDMVRCFRNIQNVTTVVVDDLNAYDVMRHRHIVLPVSGIRKLEERIVKTKATAK